MGGTPTRHHTKSRRNKGRSHFALVATKFISCPKCRALMQPHKVCAGCGYYKGREVVDVMKKANRKEQKRRERVLGEAGKK